jgi:hypothetical protein
MDKLNNAMSKYQKKETPNKKEQTPAKKGRTPSPSKTNSKVTAAKVTKSNINNIIPNRTNNFARSVKQSAQSISKTKSVTAAKPNTLKQVIAKTTTAKKDKSVGAKPANNTEFLNKTRYTMKRAMTFKKEVQAKKTPEKKEEKSPEKLLGLYQIYIEGRLVGEIPKRKKRIIRSQSLERLRSHMLMLNLRLDKYLMSRIKE